MMITLPRATRAPTCMTLGETLSPPVTRQTRHSRHTRHNPIISRRCCDPCDGTGIKCDGSEGRWRCKPGDACDGPPVTACDGAADRRNANDMRVVTFGAAVTPSPASGGEPGPHPRTIQQLRGDAQRKGGCEVDQAELGDIPEFLRRPPPRRCDHCGSQFGAMNPWDWPDRPDGIWLHPRCEKPWFESEKSARVGAEGERR